jgi:hypothetical protein
MVPHVPFPKNVSYPQGYIRFRCRTWTVALCARTNREAEGVRRLACGYCILIELNVDDFGGF